jgi:hypothetical protein
MVVPLFLGMPFKQIFLDSFGIFLCLTSIAYTRGNAEGASIWCWSGIFLFTMVFFEPYLMEYLNPSTAAVSSVENKIK